MNIIISVILLSKVNILKSVTLQNFLSLGDSAVGSEILLIININLQFFITNKPAHWLKMSVQSSSSEVISGRAEKPQSQSHEISF